MRPVLALDVDGVICLHGFDQADAPAAKIHLIEGMPHYIPERAGEHLQRLSAKWDLVWASGWEERANAQLPQMLGLPQLPVITFGGAARFGTADWKLQPLERYATGRPLAWIDDSFDARCHGWARQRSEPTLLISTESACGIDQSHIDALERWRLAGFQA